MPSGVKGFALITHSEYTKNQIMEGDSRAKPNRPTNVGSEASILCRRLGAKDRNDSSLTMLGKRGSFPNT